MGKLEDLYIRLCCKPFWPEGQPKEAVEVQRTETELRLRRRTLRIKAKRY